MVGVKKGIFLLIPEADIYNKYIYMKGVLKVHGGWRE